MRKILLSILLVLILALCYYSIFQGFNLFGFEIASFEQIQNEQKEIDDTIKRTVEMASTTYENALKTIETNMKKLEEEKGTYEELVAANEDGEEFKKVTQSQKYEIEYLWAIIGQHIKTQGVETKMDVVSGIQPDMYNLNFTVRGSYIEISDFIYAIENDPVLGFKIEDFKMEPGGGEDDLQATFTCKNIEIKEISNASLENNQEGTSTEGATDAGQASSGNTSNQTQGTTSSSSSSTNQQTSSSSADTSKQQTTAQTAESSKTQETSSTGTKTSTTSSSSSTGSTSAVDSKTKN